MEHLEDLGPAPPPESRIRIFDGGISVYICSWCNERRWVATGGQVGLGVNWLCGECRKVGRKTGENDALSTVRDRASVNPESTSS